MDTFSSWDTNGMILIQDIVTLFEHFYRFCSIMQKVDDKQVILKSKLIMPGCQMLWVLSWNIGNVRKRLTPSVCKWSVTLKFKWDCNLAGVNRRTAMDLKQYQGTTCSGGDATGVRVNILVPEASARARRIRHFYRQKFGGPLQRHVEPRSHLTVAQVGADCPSHKS
jgi:hypothetical protein